MLQQNELKIDHVPDIRFKIEDHFTDSPYSQLQHTKFWEKMEL